MPKVTITVSRRHISAGMRHSAVSCPVARAARAARAALRTECCVVPPNLELCGDVLIRTRMPSTEQDCIHLYDDGHGMEPHTFSVTLPEGWRQKLKRNRK